METMLGSAIRQARKRAGLTRSELSKRAGMSLSAITRYEAGRANPPDRDRTTAGSARSQGDGLHAQALGRLFAATASSTTGESASRTTLRKGRFAGFTLGRRSWLFAGSDRGGERAAAMYTPHRCRQAQHDIDPQAWLADVLACIAELPPTRVREFLPWNWKADRERSVAA